MERPKPFHRFGPRFIGLLVALLFVAGCGTAVSPNPDGMSVSDLLNNFVLLNETGASIAPKDPTTGLSPFGAMVFAREKSVRVFCSVTHISPGIIATAAHCLEFYRWVKPSDFYVFYYSNQTGKQEMTPVEQYKYVGQQNYDDIALLKIPDKSAKDWDVYGGGDFSKNVKRFPLSEIDNQVRPDLEKPTFEKVTIWSFRPLANPGMIFAPIHCKASRTIPWVGHDNGTGTPTDGKKYAASNKQIDAGAQLFIDGCDVTTRYGNSGASVTMDADGKLAGVFDWNLPKEKFGSNEMIYGSAPDPINDGLIRQWKRVWDGTPNEDKMASVLDVATIFESVLKRPDVMALLPTSLRLP